jgi:hypothetical protein
LYLNIRRQPDRGIALSCANAERMSSVSMAVFRLLASSNPEYDDFKFGPFFRLTVATRFQMQ